jgi:multiple sugar transport system substrate-binding protein
LRAVLAFLWPLALLACDASPRSGSADDAQKVQIRFKHGKVTASSAPIAALIDEFERRHPDIEVLDDVLPSNTDEQHRFYVINLEGESSDFDVLALDVIWVSEFSRAGWVLPLDELLTAADREDFFTGTLEAVSYGGQVNAVPWFIGAGILYYRKDLLAAHGVQPPRTWTELLRIAEAVTADRDDLHGFVWQGKQYEGLICNALEYMWSHGGGVFEQGEVALDRPENRKALAFMRDLVHRSRVSPDFVLTLTEEPARRTFQRGGAVFMRNWPYAWRLLQAEGSAVRDKVGATVLPSFEGHPSQATLGGWHLGVNRFSRQPEAAKKFVRFMTSFEAQKMLAMSAEYHPTRRSAYRDPELLAHDPFLGELFAIFESARPRPVTPFYTMISQVLQLEVSAILAQIRDPAEAMASAQRQIEYILELEK